MPIKKSNDIHEMNGEPTSIDFTVNIKLQKFYEDNLGLFQGDRGEFIDFINILKNYNLQQKTVLDDEAIYLLFKLDLGPYSIESFLKMIGLNKENQKKSLFENFKFDYSTFNDFLQEKRIIPKKDEKLFNSLVEQMSIKIESAFKKILDEEIKNIKGLEKLTKNNINKILVPRLLRRVNNVIKEELKLNLDEKTFKYLPLSFKYLPLSLDNKNIDDLKSEFYNSLLFNLNCKLAIELGVNIKNYIGNIIRNPKYEWELRIPDYKKRKYLQKCLKENLISEVMSPALDFLGAECKEYLNDNFRSKHKKISRFSRRLSFRYKSEDNKLDSFHAIKEKLDQELVRQFRSKFDDSLIEQASIFLSAEEFLPFFISLERDIPNYLKKKLSSDTFKEIHYFKDAMNFFDFKEKDLQLFIKTRQTSKDSTLLFDKYFLSPENQEVMYENEDQAEFKCKLRPNDADLVISDLSSIQERRLSKSSLHSISMKVDAHSRPLLDTLSKVEDTPLEQKKNKSKGKLTKWTCGLFCGHKKMKFNQDEAYSPVRSEFYVTQ